MLSLYAGNAGPQAQRFCRLSSAFQFTSKFSVDNLWIVNCGRIAKKFPPAWKREGIGWPRTSGEGARHARPVKPCKKIIAQMFAFVKGLRRKKRKQFVKDGAAAWPDP